ncbi:hypothetical protein [Planktomarina sp.]|uniref:hypothetical protein n=1 Tax=Planktomarina sp. TaxID=2024851 RepID=UPI003260F910
MAWILAVDHLFAHISKDKIVEFNTALAADKGVKGRSQSEDDFTEMGKFIELCRGDHFQR